MFVKAFKSLKAGIPNGETATSICDITTNKLLQTPPPDINACAIEQQNMYSVFKRFLNLFLTTPHLRFVNKIITTAVKWSGTISPTADSIFKKTIKRNEDETQNTRLIAASIDWRHDLVYR